MRLQLLLVSVLLLTSTYGKQAVAVESSEIETASPSDSTDYMSGLRLTSLSISADTDSSAILQFTSGGAMSLLVALLAESGSFVIQNERITIMEAKATGEIVIRADVLQAKDIKYYGDLYVQEVAQWKLVVHEGFWTEAKGWSMNQVTTCGGVNILGGYGVLSRGTLNKTFSDLPEHSKIRIVSTFHFIDAWTGETAYLTANFGKDHSYEYLWIDNYDSTDAEKQINICGSSYGEGKFASPIDVTFPHTDDTLTISFGSTVDQDALAESWGISALYIYII